MDRYNKIIIVLLLIIAILLGLIYFELNEINRLQEIQITS